MRGLILSDPGQYAEAIASYNKSIAINPDHAKELVNRGIALKILNQQAEAVAASSRVSAIPRANKGGCNNRRL
jgi:tetratricopeptide (TPR) repeat protein